MKVSFLIFQLFLLMLLMNACAPQSSKNTTEKEMIFIDQHLAKFIDTSFIYRYRSFFASIDDSLNVRRDTIIVSVWHEMLPLNEHLHYLPKLFREAKLEKFLSVFTDTVKKNRAAKLDFSRLNKIGRIKFSSRKISLKQKAVPGTIGDLQFYRVLFDKKNQYAVTMVRYWTGPVAAVLKLYLFEQKNGQWRKVKEEIIEQS